MKKWTHIEEDLVEKENSKVKDFLTRGLPKKVAAVGLSATIALGVMAFGGCEKENPVDSGILNQGQPSHTEQTDTQKSDKDEVIKNPIVDTPGGTTDEDKEIPVEQLQEIVEKLRNNFSCVMHVGRAMTTYEVSDNLASVEVYGQPEIFYQSDEQGNYVYTHKDEGVWEKNFAEEQFNSESILYDKMCRIEWTSYEDDSETFFGSLDGEEVVLSYRSTSSFENRRIRSPYDAIIASLSASYSFPFSVKCCDPSSSITSFAEAQ